SRGLGKPGMPTSVEHRQVDLAAWSLAHTADAGDVSAGPLLEMERHAMARRCLPRRADPVGLCRSPARAALVADDQPIDWVAERHHLVIAIIPGDLAAQRPIPF